PEEKPKDIAKEIESFLESAKEETGVEASIEFKMEVDGWSSDPEAKFVKTFHAAVQEVVNPEMPIAADLGGNDGHFFTEVGIPTACYGTLREDNSYHGLDEFMHLDDFEKVKSALISFAERCE
ncbi:MAG: M20/M25/M40 family metallo-hydrolase, partial [Candidatus Sifarchaeia archaeon]